MSELIKCEVCGQWCHGLTDGSPRCEMHLPEPEVKDKKWSKEKLTALTERVRET